MTAALRKINNEVFVADEAIVRLGAGQISFLKQQALSSNRKRARICTHRSNDDALHEMLIAISANSYIHPHKHTSKVESFHIIEGLVDVVVFDDAGAIGRRYRRQDEIGQHHQSSGDFGGEHVQGRWLRSLVVRGHPHRPMLAGMSARRLIRPS